MSEDPDDEDMMAAEFVLGTLDAGERSEAARRNESEPAFAKRVDAWTRMLAPLSEAMPASEPPPDLWPGLVRRLGWNDGVRSATILAFERQVRRWRITAAAAGALAAGLAVLAVATTFQRSADTSRPLVALLQPTDPSPAYLIRADMAGRSLNVQPLAAVPPPGRVFELWIIDPSLGKPRSLGVLPERSGAQALPAGIPVDVAARATYAITVEPPGGSPTGAPSGAPVFVGHLVAT